MRVAVVTVLVSLLVVVVAIVVFSAFGWMPERKRPYSITTVSTDGSEGTQKVKRTISGSAPC